jgi:hypothetical protein
MSDKLTKEEEEQQEHLFRDHWLKTTWRPAIAWQYVAVCLFDFILAPIVMLLYYHFHPDLEYFAWEPLTLQGGGLYHLSMGAITGVTAWSRGQEKINGVAK